MPALYRGPKKGYRLSKIDRLILAVSIWGEAGEGADAIDAGAVAWAMMDRYMLFNLRWVKGNWPFGRFIRSFSQPVNPEWLDPSGNKCTRNPASCTASHIKRRKKFQGFLDNYSTDAGWARVLGAAPNSAKYAQMFYDGKLDNPFFDQIYDFGSCNLTKSQVAKGIRPSHGLNLGDNCFLRYHDLNEEERKSVIPGDVYVGLRAHISAVWPIIVGAVGGILLFLRRKKD